MRALHCAFSQNIWKASQGLMQEIAAISGENFFLAQFEGTGGKVSAANLLAYQIGWGQLLQSWYQQGCAQQPFQMPGEGFDSWQYTAIAQHFYQKYAALDRAALQGLFLETVHALLHISEEAYARAQLDAVGIWPWCTLASGKPWPLRKWIQVNSLAPYQRATKLLRAARGR